MQKTAYEMRISDWSSDVCSSDLKPTGSKDPYALRRAALGVIRLVIENKLSLPLRPLFRSALSLQVVQAAPNKDGSSRDTVQELMQFFVDRLTVNLREQDVGHELLAAFFAKGGADALVRRLATAETPGRFQVEGAAG